MNDVIYWVWLSQLNGEGSSDAVKLLKHYEGGAKEIYEAPYEEISAHKECGREFLRRLTNHDLTRAEQTLEFCFMNGIRVIPCNSDNYPRRLRELYNKPVVLYVRGMIEDLDDRFCVSIVGTRNMSGYGKHMTFTLARQLMAYGAIIISGAAYGIDSAANNTAAFMEEPTVAVLGSGVNVPYPPKNKELIDWIGKHGMVISEFEPNTPPYGRNFPIRNRIISGLSDAVIVVEAPAKSGALITARYAQEQGRAVYAVPGNVGAPNSVGPNCMIRDGAKAVTRTEDIIEDFADKFKLEKIDRIVNSDKYMRYEYNSKFPMSPENRPLSPREQDAGKGFTVPKLAKEKTEQSTSEGAKESTLRSIGGFFKRNGAKRSTDKPSAQKYPQKPVAKPVAAPAVKTADRERILNLCTESERRVFDAIPEGGAVDTDHIARSGVPTSELLSSLTVLELYGAIESLPGGLYKRLI